VSIATQTSRKKRHKFPIAWLHNVLIWSAQTSHFRDTNRTSSLFVLFPGLWEKSVGASPLRWRAASCPPIPSKFMEGGSPLPNHPPQVIYARAEDGSHSEQSKKACEPAEARLQAGMLPGLRVGSDGETPMKGNYFPVLATSYTSQLQHSSHISFALTRGKGERCLKVSVHHMSESVSSPSASPSRSPERFCKSSTEKKLDLTHRAIWPRRGRVLGWNDPTFLLACAPKRVCGVVPAYTLSPKGCTVQMFAIQIPAISIP
jgi:hypothetical protein